jgi:hypothetical protein
MQPPLVHGMLHLLVNAMVAAQWQTPVDPPLGEALHAEDEETASQATKPSYRH